jgi:hypothetical protein
VSRAVPAGVIQGICDLALNAEQGDAQLIPNQMALFRTHRKEIATLTSPRVSITCKRKIIQSQEGGFIIPALIGAAISAIGGKHLEALFGGNKQ